MSQNPPEKGDNFDFMISYFDWLLTRAEEFLLVSYSNPRFLSIQKDE